MSLMLKVARWVAALACLWMVVAAAVAPPTKSVRSFTSLVESNDVELFGRFDGNRAQWSGTGFQMNVVAAESTATVNVKFASCSGSCKYHVEAFVDCASQGVTEISEQASDSVQVYVPPSGGASKLVRFVKRTEASCADAAGVMVVGDVSVSGGTVVAGSYAASKNLRGQQLRSCSSTPPAHNILFIGDSITAAYGVDGIAPCSFTAFTETSLHSYATYVATAVNAEAHLIAWSGIGVVRNYGDSSQLSAAPMPVYYNRTIATEPTSFWSPGQWKPDLVYVQLGTNDYSTYPQPTDEQFRQGYAVFLAQIRFDYPDAKLLIACAPMKNVNQCENILAVSKTNNVQYVDIPSSTMDGAVGCSGHPNAQGQMNLANYILPTIRSLLST
jgi:lysophospholipase L1-like esterase